jgi:hypothetical protein
MKTYKDRLSNAVALSWSAASQEPQRVTQETEGDPEVVVSK